MKGRGASARRVRYSAGGWMGVKRARSDCCFEDVADMGAAESGLANRSGGLRPLAWGGGCHFSPASGSPLMDSW